ncbi:MAG TPA: L-histidine N(alpha)-methyltransferase [Acidimicrobiales bacterium]|nr:L-histidine N(alpha)-methyltransferase [Acidimicrobiales bacterium]
MSTVDDTPVDVLLQAQEWQDARARDVQAGLAADPPELSPVWFYDERGSVLFDEITRLPEYYQTRAERRLLRDHVDDLAALGIETLVELGSGTSDKTVEILGALDGAGTLRTYVPFDVSEATLRGAIDKLGARFPDLAFHGIVGDFHQHLGRVPTEGRTLVAFLGGTIGNFRPAERARFFDDLASAMDGDDLLLIGIDLVKDPATIVAAYDDAAGVTAAFNRNSLVVLDRELGADFDPSDFDHVARWNAEERWIEMRLRARRPIHATIPDLDVVIDLREGEDLLTEISAKFDPAGFAAELAAHGFAADRTWVSDGDEFALVLARRCR